MLGEWDDNVPTAQTIFGKLSNGPYKRLVQIGAGSHLVFMENNRMQLFREMQLFLDDRVFGIELKFTWPIEHANLLDGREEQD